MTISEAIDALEALAVTYGDDATVELESFERFHGLVPSVEDLREDDGSLCLGVAALDFHLAASAKR